MISQPLNLSMLFTFTYFILGSCSFVPSHADHIQSSHSYVFSCIKIKMACALYATRSQQPLRCFTAAATVENRPSPKPKLRRGVSFLGRTWTPCKAKQLCSSNTDVWWFGGLAVMALDLPFDGCEFDSRPPRLIVGWMTVFRRVNNRSISQSHPGQFSLLLSAGREMSTSQSAMTCQ